MSDRMRVAGGRAARSSQQLYTALVQRATRAGLPRPDGLVRAALVAVALMAALLVFTLVRTPSKELVLKSAPPPPKAPSSSEAAALQRAEQALAQADLPAARAVLQQELSSHPDSARARYLLGNLHFAEGSRNQVLADYHEAMRLDGGYRGDATLLANLRSLLDDKTLAEPALALLTDEVGAPAKGLLDECARTCRDARTRRAAGDALARLAGPTEPIAAGSDLAKLIGELETGKSCKDRKRAVQGIKEKGDPRAIDALRRARERRGGFMGLEHANGCMLRDLDEALKALGARVEPAAERGPFGLP